MQQQNSIVIIDGQGGKIGAQLVNELLAAVPAAAITAVGTNSTATAAMKKAGAHSAATGENAVLVACRHADVIIGPLGIVIADSLVGEVSPSMAVAVGQSRAEKILIPVNRCNNMVAGVQEKPVASLIAEAVQMAKKAFA